MFSAKNDTYYKQSTPFPEQSKPLTMELIFNKHRAFVSLGDTLFYYFAICL